MSSNDFLVVSMEGYNCWMTIGLAQSLNTNFYVIKGKIPKKKQKEWQTVLSEFYDNTLMW